MVYKAFCEHFEDDYNEFLEENNIEDTDTAQEIFARSRPVALDHFEYNFNQDILNGEMDKFDNWLKAEGE